jgi:hypothetical protein
MSETDLRIWAMELAVEAGCKPGKVCHWAEKYLAYLFPEPQQDATGAACKIETR